MLMFAGDGKPSASQGIAPSLLPADSWAIWAL
jgi:hypothetical protein